MRHEPEKNYSMSDSRPGDALPSRPTRRNSLFAVASVGTVFLLLFCVAAVADDDNESAVWLREFIDHQVGGIDKLKVPATDAEIPLPIPSAGHTSYRYETTEAKRYLGKLLFHDPVRTARIDINTGQPKDLPTGTDFGGTINATDPLIRQIFPETSNTTGSEIQNIVAATKQTGSCGSAISARRRARPVKCSTSM